MAEEVVFLIEEASDGGLTAKALGHSIFTEAEDWEELRQAARDAVKCHFEPVDISRIIRLHFVRDEVLVI